MLPFSTIELGSQARSFSAGAPSALARELKEQALALRREHGRSTAVDTFSDDALHDLGELRHAEQDMAAAGQALERELKAVKTAVRLLRDPDYEPSGELSHPLVQRTVDLLNLARSLKSVDDTLQATDLDPVAVTLEAAEARLEEATVAFPRMASKALEAVQFARGACLARCRDIPAALAALPPDDVTRWPLPKSWWDGVDIFPIEDYVGGVATFDVTSGTSSPDRLCSVLVEQCRIQMRAALRARDTRSRKKKANFRRKLRTDVKAALNASA